MIKSKRMKWAGYVARMQRNMNADRLLVAKPEGKGPQGDQDVGGHIILN
jgi:hypothetical protein